ncbi:MAG: hypothetical protein Ct9H300mP21_08910 [Pseudomonadota bacterium]|nr:MAG: hypothetical protein Ct9H300mP21_08910 [Pseudomonadota bacterium]
MNKQLKKMLNSHVAGFLGGCVTGTKKGAPRQERVR